MTRPTALIEDWLPFDAIGAESLRERGASSALPPLYFLHAWWARRPLTVSRAVVAASLLPSWQELQAHAGPGHPLRPRCPALRKCRAPLQGV
jgi:putative DNA methylase